MLFNGKIIVNIKKNITLLHLGHKNTSSHWQATQRVYKDLSKQQEHWRCKPLLKSPNQATPPFTSTSNVSNHFDLCNNGRRYVFSITSGNGNGDQEQQFSSLCFNTQEVSLTRHLPLSLFVFHQEFARLWCRCLFCVQSSSFHLL
jgi:hypothetical protein